MLARARLSFISLVLASLAGCASWWGGDYKDPAVHLVRVETVKARLMQQAFILHFRIVNPNDSTLQVRNLHYAVYLADLLLAEGDHGQWFRVDGHSQRVIQVPVRTNLWRQLKPIAKLLKHPERAIPYRLEGELSSGLFFARDLHLLRKGEIIPADLIPE
ncbi:LEA type 2 family protein [Pseudomonas aegrilactucae]|uniref:LEA type 2 family protein n=1 Tax=Pseudomonas aegrilactucae TaxID=2854028 RepID=A0A9Q3ACX2_9PSED|nr:LEA type 2 family protein [Pseudomonas aegrilactucae]MBV6285770.1 LEA type 2 family protein [Pseudomonas aegrilactucae]